MESSSKIAEFYRGKNILITGATGFVGKLLIEKLLRVCQPNALYLLIRPKKSVDPQERLDQLFKSPIFGKLKTIVPEYKSQLNLVAGDMMEPCLGLADADREILKGTIQVVFHVAATVKFDEALPIATRINVIGTKCVLELCKEMTKLESLVYVSTAYSNCPLQKIDEVFYDPPISSENLIKLTECLKEHQLDKIMPWILDKWPNTYAFTKAVAEETVKIHGKGLPLAVFRPAIMVSTRSDPVPGWIDNLYGPTGIMVGIGAGLIRVVTFDGGCKADLVPADMTINCLLAVGYKTAICPSELNIPIYNFTTHNDNILTWKKFMEATEQRGHEVPSSRTLWYYTVSSVQSTLAFLIVSLLIHTLPALLVDIVLTVFNKNPRALKIYRKVHKFNGVIAYFSLREWSFNYDNVNSLWQTLGKKDQELFDFDMSKIDWWQFLRNSADGIRLYMFEEKLDNLPYAKKRFFMLMMLHRAVQVVFYSSFAWFVWSLGSFTRWAVITT